MGFLDLFGPGLGLAGSAEPTAIGQPGGTSTYWRPVIITTNPLNDIEHRLSDDYNRQWFSHYATDGSGFGYLTWRCKREVGYNYDDLGYAFPVVMRKGPFNVLFSGQIVRIFERQSRSGSEIEVWALGWIHVASADTFNQIYCDTRLGQWQGSEEASGSFQPGSFDWDTSDRLYFKPRRGVDFGADDYTYLRYTFPFGETAARITASYDVALPNSWPGKLEVRDSGGTVLWSTAATGTGSVDETTSGSPTYFEVRFYCTAAGENTAEDDTVYGKLTDVKVYSVDETTLDAKVIGDDLVAERLSLTGHGLSDRTDNIEAPGLALEPAAFDTDMTPAQILTWCCQFGDSDGDPLAWGVTFDDRKRLFIESVNLTDVLYVVKPESADLERGGDWGESAQTVYGVYSDTAGRVGRTDDRTSQDAIDDLGGYYRRVPLQVSGVTDATQALVLVDLWLDENDYPQESGAFTVRQNVWRPDGRAVSFDEIVPDNGLIQVREWRAHEATLSPIDYRDKKTTFPLAGVRVDEDNRSAELIPRVSSDAFARQMAIIQQLIE